jgi:ABC-type Zn uptake system ZnuABC Zn-binding protein ZnuA
MKRYRTALFTGLLALAAAAPAKVRVVCSTTDIAAIVRAVGGDLVEVTSIAKGSANPHFVEVLPTYMMKVARARVYFKVGMGLDLWADRIIDGSRNGRLLVVDCSRGIDPLEKPRGKVDASMGDVHPQGNPHYWLSPENGEHIAKIVAAALEEADPKHAADYERGLRAFLEKLHRKTKEWEDAASALRGLEIVTYHDSWPYFARTFGIRVVGFVEPKPGIEPTPSHTAELIELMKARKVRIIVKEPYYSDRTPKSIARETGAVVVDLPPSVGGDPRATDYFTLFDVLIEKLKNAMEAS